LHNAAQSGHLTIVKLLFISGADVNIQNSDHKTALDVARDDGRLDVERLLVKWMGGVDSQDCLNLILFDPLSEDAFPNAEQSSAGQGDDTNVTDGRISLHTASAEGDLEIMQSLLDGGANVDDRDAFHRTALLVASGDGKFEVAQLLVRYEADVNSTDGVGWTPLHAASRDGHFDIVHLLLDHGTDVNAKKVDRWTALHLASYFNFFDIAKALVERGANAHERNDEGRTPFQLAEMRRNQEIMRLLSEYSARGVVDH
jgi:serine/threonine-protein phosphatase 6 regulatory ankyrin repeat subunit B